MVVIRLSRRGRKHVPHYAILVADQRSKNTGKFIERIGYINVADSNVLDLDLERYDHWVQQGAQPTDRVKQIFNQLKDKQAS